MKTPCCPATKAHTQRGAVLVVGLIMLLILTLLSTAAVRSTNLEERMTNNTQDLQIAFQVAEAALREGESLLQQPMLPAFNNASGLYKFQAPDGENPQTIYTPQWKLGTTQWRSASVTADAPPAPLDKARGEFVVEEMLVQEELSPGESLAADSAADTRERIIYRVTSRAWGASGRNNPEPMVLLQSTFKR